MTVFNFPDTAGKPTDGTFTWTAPNGLLYSWDGDAWRTLGGGGDGNASITITDDLSTIPAPDAGDLAWHTIEARMYIYYQDDDSQQWVDASPAGDSDSYWERNGTTLEPVTDGDDIQTTGDLSAAAGTFSGTGAIGGPLQVGTDGASGAVSPRGMISFDSAGASPSLQKPLLYHKQNVGLAIRSDYIIDFERVSGGDADKLSARIDENGNFKLGGSPDGTNGSPNITLNSTGISDFAGKTAQNKPRIRLTDSKTDGTGNRGQIRVTADSGVGSANNAIQFYVGDTNTGSITYAGNTTFFLEPENPANFTAEGEYTGPTLDVKDRLINLISRLDALEANEVIDDATDTSLLQLIASASSRLDSIEARLTALEGGN